MLLVLDILIYMHFLSLKHLEYLSFTYMPKPVLLERGNSIENMYLGPEKVVLMKGVLFRRVKSTENSTNSAGTFQNCSYEERVPMERVLIGRDDCSLL